VHWARTAAVRCSEAQCVGVGMVLFTQCWASAEVHWGSGGGVARRCEASRERGGGGPGAGAGAAVPRQGRACRMRPGRRSGSRMRRLRAAKASARRDRRRRGARILDRLDSRRLERPDRCGSSPQPSLRSLTGEKRIGAVQRTLAETGRCVRPRLRRYLPRRADREYPWRLRTAALPQRQDAPGRFQPDGGRR
jgi:hypothetical protein